MDDKERYERGMAKRRKVLGDAWVDRANARKTAFNEEFQDFITRTAWARFGHARIMTSAPVVSWLSAPCLRSTSGRSSACTCERR